MLEQRKRVKKIMEQPLPLISHQRRLPYRPSIRTVCSTYNLLNIAIFEGELSRPEIELMRSPKYWGMCSGDYLEDGTPVCLKIKLSDKYFTQQWFVTILAHEMSHQWQWEIIGAKRAMKGLNALMNHRSSFFTHKQTMAELGIPLKSWHRNRKWFKTQDLFRC
jgi:hypothetical protein